jgi:hypothetical protein
MLRYWQEIGRNSAHRHYGFTDPRSAFALAAEGEGLEPPHRLITGSAVFKTARLPITVALLFQRTARAAHPGANREPADPLLQDRPVRFARVYSCGARFLLNVCSSSPVPNIIRAIPTNGSVAFGPVFASSFGPTFVNVTPRTVDVGLGVGVTLGFGITGVTMQ